MAARPRKRVRLLGLSALLISVAIIMGGTPKTTYGAFPGVNGLIAWERAPGPPDEFPTGEIFTMDPNNPSSVQNLTNSSADNREPHWSADGKRIALACCEGNAGDIWIMNADGSGLVQITSGPDFDREPAWSPDGKMIAFEREPDGPSTEQDVWIVPAVAGSDPIVALTPLADGCDEAQPAWSTSGLIAVSSNFDESDCVNNLELHVIDPATNTRRTVTDTSGFDEHSPNWSPDSTRIVYHRDPEGSGADSDIFVIEDDNNLATTGTQLTSFAPDGAATEPAWSPDGTKIAFAARFDLLSDLSDIFTMNADGSNETQLTDIGSPSNAQDDFHPDWQPTSPSTPPPPVFNPSLTVNPAVVRQGFVLYATGAGFPPGATVSLSLLNGIPNAKPVLVDASGAFRVPVLIYPRDTLGRRALTATGITGPSFSPVSRVILVVPGSQQPRDFVVRN